MNNLLKSIQKPLSALARSLSFLNPKLTQIMEPTQPYDPSLLKDTKLKRPMSREGAGAEVAALNSLLGLMNNPEVTGAQVPPGEDVKAPAPGARITATEVRQSAEALDRRGQTIIGRDPVMEAGPAVLRAPVTPTEPPAAPVRKPIGNRIFLTGRIKMGKDYVAAASEAKIFNLADPLYALAEYSFGVTVNANEGKEIPGVRDFLQTAGQWGRGEVNAKYPLTPGRAVFIKFVRALVNEDRLRDIGVDWRSFGVNENIWLEACVAMTNSYLSQNPGNRVIISGVRFVNEFKFLRAAGWNHYHVMASPATWQKRLVAAKIPETSPALKDMSEGLAASLDNDVTRKISQVRHGNKLHVIWNDPDVAAPSQRLLSLNQFLQELAIADIPEELPPVAGASVSED